MTRKGIGISINLIVTLALAMIVILVSAVVYDVGASSLTDFFQGNFNLTFGGGG